MFELALPWVLIALPLPWLIWFLLPPKERGLQSALKVPFYNQIIPILSKISFSHRENKISLFFLIWALLLFALAGPRWVGEAQPLSEEGYNIMLALDISGSMQLSDMLLKGRPATRLTVVKNAAEQFVEARTLDKIGLILFGTRAYLQTPLTYDKASILYRLEDATVGLAGKTTSIGDALGLAIKHLENVPHKGRIIILLTDGANNSGVLPPIKAAEMAKEDDIKIYTIGLGAEPTAQGLNGLFFNMNMSADLDEDTLKEVAKITGGQYFKATDAKSLQMIYQNINQLEKIAQEEKTLRPQHELYYWPLALAVLLFLWCLLTRVVVLPRFKRVQQNEVILK